MFKIPEMVLVEVPKLPEASRVEDLSCQWGPVIGARYHTETARGLKTLSEFQERSRSH